MTEKSFPLVSIGVMTYNHQDFITDCLESIRLQNYPNIEVIVSDDVSKDNTAQVIRDYQAKHPHFVFNFVAQPKNLGVTENCNFLLSQSKGKYVICFAGDDIMMPGKIKKQVEVLEKNPEAPFTYSNCEWFDSTTGKKLFNHFGLLQQPPRTIADLVADFTIPSPTIMMRQSFIPAHGYDTRITYSTDFLIALEMMEKGMPIYIPEILVRYRKHKGSLMAQHFFTEDRYKIISILQEKFGHDPNMKTAIKRYKTLYAYAFICENFVKGNFKEGFKMFPSLFPYCFASVKWLARDVWIGSALIKGLKKKLISA